MCKAGGVCLFGVWGDISAFHTPDSLQRASQGLVKDSPTFKNFSITARHYFSAIGHMSDSNPKPKSDPGSLTSREILKGWRIFDQPLTYSFNRISQNQVL